MKPLIQIHKDLQKLNGVNHIFSVMDFVKETDGKNTCIFKENKDDTEALICLNKELLERVNALQLPNDFSFNNVSDVSIVIEELSHFITYCHKAEKDDPISQLELEVQAEVDKFALILSWLSQKNEEDKKHDLFDRLFGDLNLGDWVPLDSQDRYKEAHEIARSFCRSILNNKLNYKDRRKVFQKFFLTPASEKLSVKY
jgi:hypothetical protein